MVAVIVMGVSGSGKSTLGAALADRLGVTFVDADDLHPRTNVAKMAAGEPLDDADRLPWLAAVGRRLRVGSPVIACSALKRDYRDYLRAVWPAVVFIHPEAPRDELIARIAARSDHFMPASLLDSQLATLEPLQADEAGVTIDATRPVAEMVGTSQLWISDFVMSASPDTIER